MLELPDIITIGDHNGNWDSFFDAVYQVFRNDFVLDKPIFEGRRLGLKCHPLVDGKEYTFYHFTHDGRNENERLPNFRRMERIPFPRPIIENSNDESLKVWRKKKGKKERILIYHEEESYLVVLEDRGDYILPWTAYLVDYSNQRRKLLSEYETYKNAKTAQ